MAKIRTYDAATGEYSNDSPAEKALGGYIPKTTIAISLRWFPVGYPHIKTVGIHKTKEGMLQALCRRYLQEQGILTLRAETGMSLRHTGDGGHVAVGSPLKDWPDLLLFLPPLGRVAGIELKCGGGHATTGQLGRLASLIDVGGLGAVICSVEGLKNFLAFKAPLKYIEKAGGLALRIPIPVF